MTLTQPFEGQPVRGATSCRHCASPLSLSLVDLGKSPLCQTVLTERGLGEPEIFYPLHAKVCTRCWLVQIPEFVPPDGIFSEYAYFSAYSDSWVEHARRYVEMIVARLSLTRDDLVVELASNDGYLLQHFLPHGVPVLGIDPARNVAEAAVARGVPTLVEFFGLELARQLVEEGRRPRLVLGNNVLAQVPDINDFVAGVKALLARWRDCDVRVSSPGDAHRASRVRHDLPRALLVLLAVRRSARSSVSTGWRSSMSRRSRLTAGRCESSSATPRRAADVSPACRALIEREDATGLRDPETYRALHGRRDESKRALLELLIDCAERGQADRRLRRARQRATRS